MNGRYEASVTGAHEAEWTGNANGETFPVSVPSSFGGEGQGTTPEHLYAASLLNCYVATFRVIAKKSNIDVRQLDAQISVELNTENDVPLQSARIDVNAETDSTKMRHVADKAKEHCYIHQSVETDITINLNDHQI